MYLAIWHDREPYKTIAIWMQSLTNYMYMATSIRCLGMVQRYRLQKGEDESRINRWARSSITTCIFGVSIDTIDPVTRARGTGQDV